MYLPGQGYAILDSIEWYQNEAPEPERVPQKTQNQSPFLRSIPSSYSYSYLFQWEC